MSQWYFLVGHIIPQIFHTAEKKNYYQKLLLLLFLKKYKKRHFMGTYELGMVGS